MVSCLAGKVLSMKISKPKHKVWLSIQANELKLMDWLFALRGYVACLPWARAISFVGDGWLYTLVAVTAYFTLGSQHPYFWMLLMGFMFERPSYYLLKNSIKRQRPFKQLKRAAYLMPSDEFSLPSGHTSAAFLFAVITATFVPQYTLFLILAATLIGLSRVFLGVHFLTDVLMGAVIGISYGVISFVLMNKFFEL